MKKQLILIAAILLFTACGTVHRVTETTHTKTDSTSTVKRDSLHVVKSDTASHKEDHSVVTTTEHVVNDYITPGDTSTATAKLSTLLTGAAVIYSPDSSGKVILSYDAKDSTFTADVYNKPEHQHQTIDRTTTDQKNISQDTRVHDTDSTKTDTKQVTKKHVDTTKKHTDKTATGITVPWYMWAILGIFVAAVSLILYFYLKAKNKFI